MRAPLVVILVASAFSAGQTVTAQTPVTLPTAQNLPDHPVLPTDVVISVGQDGRYVVNANPLRNEQVVPRLRMLLASQPGDKVVYLNANADLPFARILATTGLATKSGACVVSFIAQQQPGTRSALMNDARPSGTPLERRALDVQLSDSILPAVSGIEQGDRIVLEVLPGQAYRINTTAVASQDLAVRLRQIYNPRPVKVLVVKGEPTATYQEVLRAVDIARGAGVFVIGLPIMDTAIPTALPPINLAMKVTAPEAPSGAVTGRCRRPGDRPAAPAMTTGTIQSGDRPYYDFQVERPVRQIPGSGQLKYPDVLRSAGVEGQVFAEFVVDAEGRYEPDTFRVIKSAHDLFTQSVRAALPEMRFTPAEIGGKKVRQLVQQPFTFAVSH